MSGTAQTRRGRRRRMVTVVCGVAMLAVVLLRTDLVRTVPHAFWMQRTVWRLSRDLASSDPETRRGCFGRLGWRNTVTGDSPYAHLSPEAKSTARSVVLEAMEDPSHRVNASRAIYNIMKTDMHDDADQVASHLDTADPRVRFEVVRALAATGNAESIRRHLGDLLLTEDDRGERINYAGLLWCQGLGPVDARMLTRRAGGRLPATEPAAVEELRDELAGGGEDPALALYLAGHGELLDAERSAEIGRRLER